MIFVWFCFVVVRWGSGGAVHGQGGGGGSHFDMLLVENMSIRGGRWMPEVLFYVVSGKCEYADKKMGDTYYFTLVGIASVLAQ